MTAAPAPIIELRGVTRVYGEGNLRVPILRGIDLRVQPGEIVSLVGPSGCGKSTLLNIVGCLDRPSAGDVRLGGREVSTLGPVEQAWVRLHFIGFIFQAMHLVRHLDALENVALPLYYAGVRRAERQARAAEWLRRLGLGDRLRHRPNQLSGGQQQRVAIARALCAQPRLLLADEPTGALDSRTGEEVMGLLAELHAELGVTMIIVTHDPHVAAFAPRRIRMQDGRVVAVEQDAP